MNFITVEVFTFKMSLTNYKEEKNFPASLKNEIGKIMLYCKIRSHSLKLEKGKMLTFIATTTYFAKYPRNII